jgi:hypothetical protein
LLVNVEDLAKVDVAPDLGPSGLQISSHGLAEFVGCVHVAALLKVDLTDSEVNEGTLPIRFKCFLALFQRIAVVALAKSKTNA